MRQWRAALGLRSSVVLTFALGALALSTVLAVGTYVSARHFLVEQRERTALRQAYTDAALVRDNLTTTGSQVSEVLGSVAQPAGTTMFVTRNGRWYSSSLDGAGEEATEPFREDVGEASVVVGWSRATSPASVVVGIPLPSVGAEFYEVSVAEELDSTLRTLAAALAICALLTTAGGAFLGRLAAGRVLSPLGQVTTAAVRVSSGDLGTRLPPTEDPDLAVLVGSFNHMVDALRERIEQDARFAADVAHELRTPLTTLTNSLSYLQRVPDLTPDASTAVALMTSELDHFGRALQDLLRLGRLDAEVPEGERVTVPVGDVVTQALRASQHAADLLAPDPANDLLVTVDRAQVLRSFTNLLDNADRHGDGVVGVRVVDSDRFVDVLVEDRGPGIAAADRERVFERFARVGGRKPGTGSGLGLSIVERSIRNQGGSVWCTPGADGRGACFVVRLPLAGTEQARTEQARTEQAR